METADKVPTQILKCCIQICAEYFCIVCIEHSIGDNILPSVLE